VLDTHPYDRASKTILVLNLSNPHPPYSGEIYNPAYPYYAASLNTSLGK